MKKMTKAAIFLLLLLSGALIRNALIEGKAENHEPEIPLTPTESEATYFTSFTEASVKEMEDFFEENEDAFNALYAYLAAGELSTVVLTLEEGRFRLYTTMPNGEQAFSFFNADSPAPQILNLLAGNGMVKLLFIENTVRIYYPRIPRKDPPTSYVELYYKCRETPEQDDESSEHGAGSLVELSGGWTIEQSRFPGR